MTVPPWLAIILILGSLCANLGRAALSIMITHLSLKHSKPSERIEILKALTPTLIALVAETDPTQQGTGRQPTSE
jgi:hypothetical protein